MLTAQQRTLRARAAAHALHAKGRTNTAPGTQAFLARWEREVDPEGLLEPAERARRADHAKKAWFTALALKSSRARAGRTQGKGPPDVRPESGTTGPTDRPPK
jgi:hypothetical protein